MQTPSPSLMDRIIPAELQTTPLHHAQAKNTLGFTAVAMLAAPPFAGLYAWQHHTSGAWAILLLLACSIASVGVMRATASMWQAQWLGICGLYLLFVYLLWSIGGNPANPLDKPELMYMISNLGVVPSIAMLTLFFQLSKDQGDTVRAEQVCTIEQLMSEVNTQTRAVSALINDMVGSLSQQNDQAVALHRASEANHQLASSVEEASHTLAQEAEATKGKAQSGADVVGSVIGQAESLAASIGDAAHAINQDVLVVLDHISRTARLLGNSHDLAESSRLSAAQAKDSLQTILNSVLALDDEASRLRLTSQAQLGQNTQLARFASDMEQGIAQVAHGSSSIKQAMDQLSTRLSQMEA
jgi:Trp operon repressor